MDYSMHVNNFISKINTVFVKTSYISTKLIFYKLSFSSIKDLCAHLLKCSFEGVGTESLRSCSLLTSCCFIHTTYITLSDNVLCNNKNSLRFDYVNGDPNK